MKGWNWADEPERYKPIKCAVCDRCFLDLKTGHCVFGGPYRGYQHPDGRVETLEEWRAMTSVCSEGPGRDRVQES